ncbi:MAG TPA: hypothetical protein VL400_12895 [Polyangiaceae bacterium]|jgi:hypothetical protein|nr:hypothetical protein [Polyangiaceae bacterium]
MKKLVARAVIAFAAPCAAAFFATSAEAQETIVVPSSGAAPTSGVYTTQNGQPVQVIVVQQQAPAEAAPPRRRRRIAADDGPPPAGYHEETTTLKGLWIAGISVLGAGYLLTILSGSVADAVDSNRDGKYVWYSLIPVGGPFVIAAQREISGPADPYFVLLGVLQVAGTGMIIGGVAAQKTYWVTDEAKVEPLVPELRVGAGWASMRVAF